MVAIPTGPNLRLSGVLKGVPCNSDLSSVLIAPGVFIVVVVAAVCGVCTAESAILKGSALH